MGTALTTDASGRPYRDVSLWFDQVGDDVVARPGLVGDAEADVVVVGAGLTGLWTAYYLTEADPGLEVVVVEQETAGYGASGRNGGWCSALFPVAAASVARRHGEPAARALRAAMRDTVVEVGGVAAAEGIDCDFRVAGRFHAAHSPNQYELLTRQAANQPKGLELPVEVVPRAEQHRELGTDAYFGGVVFTRHAAVDPARYHRGLLDRVRAAAGLGHVLDIDVKTVKSRLFEARQRLRVLLSDLRAPAGAVAAK